MTISYYNGGSSISGIPNRNYFLEESKLDASSTKPLLFMPCDVEDLIDYRHKTYSLRMTGFTDAGFKLCIIVENIDVFFDVRCPKDEHIDKFAYNIMSTMDINELIYRKIDTVEAYPLFGFHERPIPYKRVYTTDLQTRRKAIELIRQKGYETANDDLSCYYRKVARDYHLPISNWLVIKQHRLKVNGGLATTYVDINNITPYNGELTGNLKRERCLVMTWDIETYSSSNTGDVPKPERSTDYIFMICCSFHWAMDSCDTEPLYKVCIVDKEIVDQEGVHTIICKDEINIIKAFGLLVKAMLPDILIGFNDHDYDWNFLIERAHQCGLLKELYNNMSIIPNTFASDDYVYNRLVMKKNIKISPEETMFCRFVKPVGLIPIDIRVCFKKLYKKEEITKGSSLNFYLKLNKLDQKVDLPHTEMFKIYEEGDPEKLSLVRHYCVIDSVSCFRLFSKQLIMSTLRENATLSYISIFDENFYAVSMKIANKIIAEGLHRNILCSNITKEKTLTDKFSGAHVFDPEKGLEDSRPVIPEDFKSLYPSIIMAYNLSPETFVSTERYAEELHAKGRSTYALEFDYANERKYAWFVRHDQMEERWGLIPSILKHLFSSRVAIQQAQKTIDKSTSDGDFEYNRLEIKQKAIKVFMNSIYGVSGMDINPLFLLEQAVAITSTGKRLINTVAEFVRGKGYFVKYGDTDSVYLKPPSRYFTELDKSYQDGEIDKLQYWTRMVEISDGLSEDIRDQINVYLEELVGNTYIKMENEEVKFPVIFTGKKKYAGIAHYHDKSGKLVVDFYPKKLFIRGIDIIKEGQPMLAITIGNKILRNILDVYKPPESTVLGIVETVFNDAIQNTDQWTIDDFIQSDAYRPLKENIKVKTFVERMRKRHELQVAENKKRIESGEQPEEYIYEPPSPGERFKYVIVKQTQFYDIRGKKINLGKGDLMEFVHVVKKLGLEIDIGQYLKSKVAGICARFINYHPKFQPTDGQRTMKEIDEYCQKMAKKFLEAIVDQYMLPKIDHNKCKRAYKAVKKSVDQQLGQLGSQSVELFGRFEELEEIDTESVRKTLSDLAKDSLRTKQADIERRNKEMLKLLNISEKTGTDIDGMTSKNLFKNYKIIDLIIERNHRVIDKVYEDMNLYELTQLIKKYNTNFEQLVLHTRELDDVSDLSIGGLLDESDHKVLEIFKDQFNILVCEVECLISNMKLKEILGSLRTKRFNKRY